MSYYEDESTEDHHDTHQGRSNGRGGPDRRGRHREEVYSKRVPAGKRTYFFDVKSTRSGKDFFIVVTESKRLDSGGYEKHKVFLYKEDFGKFIEALHEVVDYIRDECLPDHDFDDVPVLSDDGYDDDYDDDLDDDDLDDDDFDDEDDDFDDDEDDFDEDDDFDDEEEAYDEHGYDDRSR